MLLLRIIGYFDPTEPNLSKNPDFYEKQIQCYNIIYSDFWSGRLSIDGIKILLSHDEKQIEKQGIKPTDDILNMLAKGLDPEKSKMTVKGLWELY